MPAKPTTDRCPAPRWQWWEWLPTVLAALIGFPALFGERFNADSGLYSAIACKGVWEGHWWTLWLAGEPYFNKPPLAFWLHMPGIALFGPEPWVRRLPDVVAMILTVVATQRIARRLSGPYIGMLAALILASTHSFVFLIDAFRIDYIHNAFLLWGIWFIVSATPGGEPLSAPGESDRTPMRWRMIGAGLCLGCALMVKPLWALVSVPILAVWLLLVRSTSPARTRQALRSLPLTTGVAIVVALPWHLSMLAQHGQAFVSQYFVRQAYDRVLSDRFKPEPWDWYLKYFAENCWSILAVCAVGLLAFLVLRRPGSRTRIDGALLLGIVWFAVWLVALSLVNVKRRYYVLHMFPGLAMVAAGLIGWLPTHALFDRRHRWCAVMLALTTTAAVFLGTRPDIFSQGRSDLARDWSLVSRAFRGEQARGPAPWPLLWDYVATVREPIYVGGINYTHAGAVYVKTRNWPIGHYWSSMPWTDVPPGALVIYDTEVARPPAVDKVEFETGFPGKSERRIYIVRRTH